MIANFFLDKNNKYPLKMLGCYVVAPDVPLPLCPYKSRLLTVKPQSSHHLLSEGCQHLQGKKQRDFQSLKNNHAAWESLSYGLSDFYGDFSPKKIFS